MKVFTQKQLQEWDRFTIENEDISSLDLIRAAGQALAEEIEVCYLMSHDGPVRIFCGIGNNGADGLVIARQLFAFMADVEVYIVRYTDRPGDDFKVLEAELKGTELPLHYIDSRFDLPELQLDTVVIDAILGTGISRPLDNLLAEVVEYLNEELCYIKIAIDIPTGMHPDRLLEGIAFVADATFTVATRKLATFYKENELLVGTQFLVQLPLSDLYYMKTETPFYQNEIMECTLNTPEASKHSYKNEFGHVLFIGGKLGQMGAARLATEGALRGGCGLVTAHVPECGINILQIAIPEAMVSPDSGSTQIVSVPVLKGYQAICLGCGMGADVNPTLIEEVLRESEARKVFDADALNIMADYPRLLELLDDTCVLTPHVGEFHRLFGDCDDSESRLQLLINRAKSLGCFIILKGHHTMVATPAGQCFFNNTGNPVLSTAGSGDVLAGYIAGHLARGMDTLLACRRAVSYHGFAGDILMHERGARGAIARDILDVLGRIESEVNTMLNNIMIGDDIDDDMQEIDLLENLN